MILVTGATGGLGKATIDALLKIVPASEITGLARDLSKATDLLKTGIQVKEGNYLDYASLVQAFEDVNKLILISAPTFTDRTSQQINVIKAAVQAGVKHVIYTGIQRKENSKWIIPMVTESDMATEKALEESGLFYTIVRNNIYADVLPFFLGDLTAISQVSFPSGNGKVSFVARTEFGEALANLVTQENHNNKIYTLTNAESLTFAEIAEIISGLSGTPVDFEDISREDYVNLRVEAGIPRLAAEFAADWAGAIQEGEFGEVKSDLEHLLGRKPIALKDFLQATFFAMAEGN